MQLYTDASGTQGWGAYWSGRWLQRSWSTTQQTRDITWKELFAIVMAVHTWGIYWTKQKIVFRCDNQAVVDIWEKGTTHDSYIMALVRLLYFRAAQYNINVCVMHIPGAHDYIADALSHFQMIKFHQLTPTARQAPDPIPAWPPHSFINASCNAVIMELPPLPDDHTNQVYQLSNVSAPSTFSHHCQHHP